MEKDLRDAYAALKLLRADLVKTRRDKRALEASLTQLQTHPSAAHTRERQQMQHEDASAQLLRLTAIYESRLAEMEIQLLHNNCPKKEKTPEVEDNQHEEHEGLEKLALLNKLHSLTATVEQQTQTMLAQQAAFALQKGELETALEDTQHKLQTEERKVADAVQEQQVAKENYEFLETQVEILKQEKRKLEQEKKDVEMKLESHAQTSSILKQQLEEKEEEKMKWESEQEERGMRLQLEYEQKMDALVEKLSTKFRQENEEKEKELREEHQREMVDLERKCGLLELELSSEKEGKLHGQEEMQERFSNTLRDLENTCAELKAKLANSEAKRDTEEKEHEAKLVEVQEQNATTLHDLGTELEEVRKQLAASETKMKEHETELEKALNELRAQQDVREQHSKMLRNLENNLAEVQTILAVSEAKVAEEAKKHEEELAEALQKVHDQGLDQERYTNAFRAMKNNLAEMKMQLADAENKRLLEVNDYKEKLAKTSDLAAQHEKTARALTLEKKALQQEVREVRQISKLSTEEFLKCQSVMEQKTKEHLQYLNQVQEQCESLETQLQAAEDHNVSRVAKPVEDSYTLKAYHGLSDNEITALSSSKSWALLRAGICELNGFLPQLQMLLGAISEVLTLCENHADTLPTLCERLQDKVSNEKTQPPILPFAMRLVRFTVTLKTRILQEEVPVTPKIVQDVRRNVLDALAQWYERDPDDNDQSGNTMMPTPTFTITSRETALILQNWTNDRTKQLGVRRWLARMEAYPGVPPLRGASSNRVLELPPEGCTLELEDMTPEVKDAFLLLLIPILKQNRALHVRVFTRYTGDRGIASKQHASKSNDEDDHEAEKVWAMRIIVQSAITKRTRSIGRPAPLKLAPSPRSPSPLAPISPASSVSSSTSSTASSRLQIIQERLHYLHNNG